MGSGPVVRLKPVRPGAADGADVPVPDPAMRPVYSDRMRNNDVFTVIADKTRRGILAALKDGERPVGDLVTELGVSQPTVSKHLKILREAGMVSMEAQGQRRLYAVEPKPLAEVADWIHEVAGGAVQQTALTERDVLATAMAEDSAAAVAVPVPSLASDPSPGPTVDGAVPRPSRGAGARAAEIFSSLPGLRRRTRNPRR